MGQGILPAPYAARAHPSHRRPRLRQNPPSPRASSPASAPPTKTTSPAPPSRSSTSTASLRKFSTPIYTASRISTISKLWEWKICSPLPPSPFWSGPSAFPSSPHGRRFGFASNIWGRRPPHHYSVSSAKPLHTNHLRPVLTLWLRARPDSLPGSPPAANVKMAPFGQVR